MSEHTTISRHRAVATAAGFTELYLGAIPVLDVVLNQVGNVTGTRLWGLSVFQVARGLLLLASAPLLARGLSRVSDRDFRMVAAVFLYPLALVFSAALEAASRSAVEIETVIAVLQSLYWVVVLALVLLRTGRSGQSRALENGLMAGGVAAAASVIVALVLGGGTRNVYQDAGVDASWGWFLTTKGLSGQLLVCSVVALMVGSERRSWLAYVVAACSATAAFLTYQRTGLVALVIAAVWLFVSRRRRAVWLVIRDLAVIGLAAYVVVSIPRVESVLADNLATRWRDVLDEGMRAQGRSGSGRVSLLPDAWGEFVSGRVGEVWLGRGFAGMLDAVERAGYIRIHTHNDILDVLLVGGIVGFLALVALLATVWRRLMPPFSNPTRWRYSFAIVLVWATHAMLTGQLWLPDAMSWYVLGLGAAATGTRPVASWPPLQGSRRR